MRSRGCTLAARKPQAQGPCKWRRAAACITRRPVRATRNTCADLGLGTHECRRRGRGGAGTIPVETVDRARSRRSRCEPTPSAAPPLLGGISRLGRLARATAGLASCRNAPPLQLQQRRRRGSSTRRPGACPVSRTTRPDRREAPPTASWRLRRRRSHALAHALPSGKRAHATLTAQHILLSLSGTTLRSR